MHILKQSMLVLRPRWVAQFLPNWILILFYVVHIPRASISYRCSLRNCIVDRTDFLFSFNSSASKSIWSCTFLVILNDQQTFSCPAKHNLSLYLLHLHDLQSNAYLKI
jgi:hypothetical protein